MVNIHNLVKNAKTTDNISVPCSLQKLAALRNIYSIKNQTQIKQMHASLSQF